MITSIQKINFSDIRVYANIKPFCIHIRRLLDTKMDTFTSYSTGHHRQPTHGDHGCASIDAFTSFSADYGVQHVDALPAGPRARLDGSALAVLALAIVGLPGLALALEKLA